jgi:hypothetical protein
MDGDRELTRVIATEKPHRPVLPGGNARVRRRCGVIGQRASPLQPEGLPRAERAAADQVMGTDECSGGTRSWRDYGGKDPQHDWKAPDNHADPPCSPSESFGSADHVIPSLAIPWPKVNASARTKMSCRSGAEVDRCRAAKPSPPPHNPCDADSRSLLLRAASGRLGWREHAIGSAYRRACSAPVVGARRSSQPTRDLGFVSSPDVRVRSRATRRLSLRPTNIGNVSGRRVWIATDRRLFLADRGRRSRPVRLVRSVEYPQFSAVSYDESGEDHTRLELRLGSEQLNLTLEAAEAKALLAILCRRAGPRSGSGFGLRRLALQQRPAHPAREGALTSCP